MSDAATNTKTGAAAAPAGEKVFVTFTRQFGDDKAGDTREVARDLADFLVSRDPPYAERINYEQWRAATEATRNKELSDTLLASCRGMIEEFDRKLQARGGPGGGNHRAQGQPPGSGHGVDFAALASGPDDPIMRDNARMVERVNRKIGVARTYDPETREVATESRTSSRREAAGLAEILSLVQRATNAEGRLPAAEVQYATRRLGLLSGEVTEYRFNEGTGESELVTTRSGLTGTTTIKRTGTDSVSGGTTYGFVVQPTYLGNFFEVSAERQVFVDACEMIPIASGNEVKYPAWDQYGTPGVAGGLMQSQSFAGVDLYYASENANRTPTDANLNMINFKAVDLTALTTLSRDFIADNYVNYDSQLTRMIGRAFGWMEDWVAIQGNGVGKPQGFLNAAGALSVSRGSGNTIFLSDCQKMIQAIHPMVLESGQLRWLANITTFQYLSAIQYSAGVFAFQPNAMTTQAMPFSAISDTIGGRGGDFYHSARGTFLGFPLYFTEKLPVLGSTGDLCLVAPGQYGLASRSGLEIAVSEHAYFPQDLIGFRFKRRHDGKLLWRFPYQQADGSATKVGPVAVLHS